MSRLRIAIWGAVTAIILLIPLVAMQFTAEVNWSVSDFLFMGILIFGTGLAYELVSRQGGTTAYRTAVGLGLAGAFLLVWVNAAAGFTDSDADVLYLVVVVVGAVGALVALFRPAAMARAMFATALAHTMVSVIALVAGILPAHNSIFEVLGITAFFAMPFIGSALLFREAARTEPERCSA